MLFSCCAIRREGDCTRTDIIGFEHVSVVLVIVCRTRTTRTRSVSLKQDGVSKQVRRFSSHLFPHHRQITSHDRDRRQYIRTTIPPPTMSQGDPDSLVSFRLDILLHKAAHGAAGPGLCAYCGLADDDLWRNKNPEKQRRARDVRGQQRRRR